MDLVLDKIPSTQETIKRIDAIAEANGADYIDAVLTYCHQTGADVETVAAMIKSNQKIKASVMESAERLNMLPKTSRLPV